MNTQPDNLPENGIPSGHELLNWFNGKLGHSVLAAGRNRVSRILPDLFGYHILQVGELADVRLLDSSRINHKIITAQTDNTNAEKSPTLLCKSEALPVTSESMDVVVLSHLLEFADNPHQILRETERVLIGEGHVIILGFNPWSIWGLWRLLLAWRGRPPWSGHYIGLTRLRDWLTLLDFEIIRTERFYFRPPLENTVIMQRLQFMEHLGGYCWPFFGGVYMLCAKKRVISLTPIKLQWQTRRRMIASGLVEPSARNTSIRNDC
jgi:SAM-dependent methyltransferase